MFDQIDTLFASFMASVEAVASTVVVLTDDQTALISADAEDE